MAEPFIGEIRIFAGKAAPSGWMFCEGQELDIDTNDILYGLFGNLYGGTPGQTFALPDLRGRIPVGPGPVPGGTGQVTLGEAFGAETVTLAPEALPAHSHSLSASSVPASQASPEQAAFATTVANVLLYPDSTKPTVAPRTFDPAIVDSPTGPAQPHDNMMPTTAIRYMIATDGLYPHP